MNIVKLIILLMLIPVSFLVGVHIHFGIFRGLD